MALVAPLDGELDARAPRPTRFAARAEGCGRVAVIDADGAFHQLEARGGDAALFEGDVRLGGAGEVKLAAQRAGEEQFAILAMFACR